MLNGKWRIITHCNPHTWLLGVVVYSDSILVCFGPLGLEFRRQDYCEPDM